MLSTDPAYEFRPYKRRSPSQSSDPACSKALRLADIAKQHGFGVHVEHWREDMLPVRQYLPLQHIIGSLKRDRDETVQYVISQSDKLDIVQRQRRLAATSPKSEDSFLTELRSPKRRRTSTTSSTRSYCTESDPDRRFSYQTAGHCARDIDQAALPGLNHILNLATITADERDIFSEYAPKHIDDSQLLMSEVLQMRERMIQGEEGVVKVEETAEDQLCYALSDERKGIVPPEKEAEVRKAFEDFVDLDETRFVAKL